MVQWASEDEDVIRGNKDFKSLLNVARRILRATKQPKKAPAAGSSAT